MGKRSALRDLQRFYLGSGVFALFLSTQNTDDLSPSARMRADGQACRTCLMTLDVCARDLLLVLTTIETTPSHDCDPANLCIHFASFLACRDSSADFCQLSGQCCFDSSAHIHYRRL